MNSYERVLAALNHKEADRVPVYPILSGVTRKLVGATYEEWSTNAETCAKAFLEATRQFDIDCVVTLIDLSVECDAWGKELVFSEQDAAHPNYNNLIVKEIEDYEKVQKPIRAARSSSRGNAARRRADQAFSVIVIFAFPEKDKEKRPLPFSGNGPRKN